MRCLNTKGKYGKITNTEIKWLIISKSVMIVIFVEFIDQLIDYSINHTSLRNNVEDVQEEPKSQNIAYQWHH